MASPLPANPWAARTQWGGPIITVLFVVGIAALAFFGIRERTVSAAGVENGQDATAETAATSKTSAT